MTVAWILLAKYGIPQSPNLHIYCICHVVNPTVQAILATLRKANNPDEVDYFTLNKEQPLHLNINVDSDQVGLDNKEFQDKEDDEAVPKENITLEDEEKLKATESPLSKVHILNCENLIFIFGLLICFSYATSQTRLFQPLSGGRSFGNV